MPNTTISPLGRLYSLNEAMNYLRVSRSTIYRLMRAGALPKRLVGSQHRWTQEELHNARRAS